MLAALYGVTGGFHQLQKCLKIFRLLRKRRVNGHTQQIALAGFCIAAQPLVVALAVRLRILDYRQPVLHTYKIAEFPAASVLPQKLRNFRVQSSVVEFQMIWLLLIFTRHRATSFG